MLSENIKKLRKKKRLSQDKLASLVDISYNTIAKIESGRAKNPTYKTLSRLADLSDISIDELVKKKR